MVQFVTMTTVTISIPESLKEFVEKQIKGIVGFAVDVTRIEAGYKLSQNRNDEDYWNIIHQLDQRADADSKKVASAMRARRKKTTD